MEPKNKSVALEPTADLLSEVMDGERRFAFASGDCLEVLRQMPDESMDCAITSPPYWKMREYEVLEKHNHTLIGDEDDPKDYVKNLVAIFNEVRRVLKSDGSLWLNIGDKFQNKNLMGMPWRVALAMQDEGWVLRSDIIWDQMKGTQSAKDRMRDVYEHIFHFVKTRKYYFDAASIKIKPSKNALVTDTKTISATGVSGVKYREYILSSDCLNEEEKKNALVTDTKTISATGVSGVKYREYILSSDCLNEEEKKNASKALDDVLAMVRSGELVDFRMTIRGQQRTYHSESTKISGRAKELADKGYFFIMMKAEGFLPSDIWRIVPEDK